MSGFCTDRVVVAAVVVAFVIPWGYSQWRKGFRKHTQDTSCALSEIIKRNGYTWSNPLLYLFWGRFGRVFYTVLLNETKKYFS